MPKKKLHFINFIKFTLSILISVLVVGIIVKAAPPTSLYTPGETLDPECSPGSTNCDVGLSSGSLLFSSSNFLLDQDNANLYWDNTNHRLGVGTSSPSSTLDVQGNTNIASNLTVGGNLTILGAQTYSGAASFSASSTSPVLTINQTGSGYLAQFQKDGTSHLVLDDQGNAILAGDLTQSGNYNLTGNLNATGTITLQGDFHFASSSTILGQGTLTINPTGNLYLQSSSNYIDEAGNLVFQGNLTTATGTITANKIVSPTLTYSGNITINASSSTTTEVTVTNKNGDNVANLKVDGDINIQGGKITLANGETIDTETTNELHLASASSTIFLINGSQKLAITADGA
ncbi:MAG TPA: hypothetical protein ENL06_03090, partial [Candidatus Portnoybacteria bacterium]|nr:hypothetical protein [Candidatus Portnoybacteria bacterium]